MNPIVMVRLLTCFFLAAFLAACSPELPSFGEDTQGEPPLKGATIGGAFELVNTANETVTWDDFRGRYAIVYFGFAFCPDVCPTDVQRFTRGLALLSEAEPELAAQVQPIFISIDPERDTPEVVAEFTSAFSDDLIGLTGTPEQVKAAADTFRVYYERGEDQPGGGYLVDHTNITYLFGPDGEPLATLPTDLGAEAVAEELAKWVR
jgi:protein SCO1/2